MELIFFGLLFIFFKTNILFVEIGVVYYLTNILGYISIYVGIKELERNDEKLNKLKPLAIIMTIHSVLFFLLNFTDSSPLTMPLSGSVNTIIAVLGLAGIVIGLFVVYYIIHTLIETLKYHETSISGVKRLDQLNNAMTILFIFAGIGFFFNYIPMLAEILMISLLILQVVFLIHFYNNLVKENLNSFSNKEKAR